MTRPSSRVAAFLRRVLRPPLASPWNSDELIREELFSMERLEQHAASLAWAQEVTAKPVVRRSLNARLNENDAILLDAYRAIAATIGEGYAVTPAAEWLIDNYHVMEKQIHQIKEDLPPRFYRQLPKLAVGPFIGYPRVFGLAWAYVAHSDSRFDPETLRHFVRAYQQVQPLTIGELWAVAITLRIVLVENLRRAAERIVRSRIERQKADEVADRLLGVNGSDPQPQALIHHHQQSASFSPSFVVQVVKRLRDQDPKVTPALVWLENQLHAQETTSDALVRDEHQRQGASNVTVRNIITSMRLVSDVNWSDFFEDVSLVDAALRTGSDFASMDFPTRTLYRSAIETLARGSPHSELEIAQAVIGATRGFAAPNRAEDPGYHLLSGGRRAFERAVGYRVPIGNWLGRCNEAIGPAGYIGAVLALSAIVLAVPVWALMREAVESSQLALLALLGLIPAVDMAVALVNRAVTRGFGATLLPGLALRDGIPAHLRTMIVVPVLLTTRETIETQIERLEVHYMTASHGEVHFALLSDWTDAPAASVEGDETLLQTAVDGIAALNRRHGPAAEGQRFYLFHRRRVWSAGQRQWMGWERKRGKLHELNRLLRGAADTTFIGVEGQAALVAAGVRYIITLDADTRLPRETVRRLIGKLAHPLNRPRFDGAIGRVVEGYGVLQPRVTPSLPIGREGSLFQRVFSSMTGIDPYDAAVSDVYQDLFGEGSYAGKGIYEIDAFEAALADRVPEGSLLSHDLFEGTFARAGLASDIEVVEEFPARYDVAAARNHRWARGDWQLLPWLLGRRDVARRHADGNRGGKGLLPLAGVWKMLDNLRRSLSAPTCALALVAGWLLPPAAALLWTAFVLATIVLPTLLPVLADIVPRRRGVDARSHLRALLSDLWLAALQSVFTITFLAHQAWLMTDAIGRTLFRLLVSRRNLLEWVTAAQAQLSSRLSLLGVYRRMSASVIIAVLAIVAVGVMGQGAWWIVVPFAVLWTAAPAIARAISVSPLVAGRLPVSPTELQSLRLVARRTWRFFETFVTAADHMLPPDNFQEDPLPVVAHRTSPTNLGLYLLCAISARDFGWAATLETVQRIEATLATMEKMQRCRGHFYNWYDTRDLRPLDPRYVSAVDSGNLAAHLIVVANACRDWVGAAVAPGTSIAGIEDAIELTRAALLALPDDRRAQSITRHQVEDALNALVGAIDAEAFGDLAAHAATLTDGALALASEQEDEAHSDMVFWAKAVQRAIDSWRADLAQTEASNQALDRRLLALEATARAMALAMDFEFLLDPQRKLLAIGYRADAGVLDASCYDLLASEARLASFFAIAKNDVPTRHWFRLGRPVTAIGHGAALISWSGSMFEYLMPSLVMRAPAGSLLERTNRLVVRRQIAHGAALNTPWGISESAYNARDLELTYQYSNFGVPGLGLKRGLSENVVIAPYATGLAAMIDPQAATRNFARLAAAGARGRYGFYEALDYTPSRLPEGADVAMCGPSWHTTRE